MKFHLRSVYMNFYISCLNTFILRCGSSLEDGIPSRPVAVIPVLIMAVFFVSGCSLAPGYKRSDLTIPEDFSLVRQPAASQSHDERSVESSLQLGWQSFFTDPMLQKLIALGLKHNRDLKTTALIVEEFQARYRIERSRLFPAMGTQGKYLRQKMPGSPVNPVTETFSVSVGSASYELDFFGRVRSLKDAALENYLGMESSLKTATISLVAQIAGMYFRLLADQELARISKETLVMEQESYTLMDQRFQAGITNELELVQAKSSLENARFVLAMYERLVIQDHNALRYLVGCSSWESDGPDGIFQQKWSQIGQLPLLLPHPLPSEVLLQRPDIIAAEHELKAAHANIGAARAAFFPSISLTGNAGFMSSSFSNLFEASSKTWMFAPSVHLPIFTGGRLKGQLDAANIRKDISVVAYETSIERAFREVADALAGQQGYDKQLGAQLELLKASNRYYDLAKKRYDEGLDSFLTLLDAQRLLFKTRRATVGVELERLLNQISLYKALGGGVHK